MEMYRSEVCRMEQGFGGIENPPQAYIHIYIEINTCTHARMQARTTRIPEIMVEWKY